MAQAGYTPIQLYYSTTASAAPSSGNLANGELAINITDGKLYYKDNGGTVRVLAGTGGTGVVAGSNTQVQFNNNGVFGASSSLTWNGSTLTTQNLALTGNMTSNLLFTDNTYDIGADGATRPRRIFTTGNVQINKATDPLFLAIGNSSTTTAGLVSSIDNASNYWFSGTRGDSTGGASGTERWNLLYGSTNLFYASKTGNYGFAVVPQAWASGIVAAQFGPVGAFRSDTNSAYLSANFYQDSGGSKYINGSAFAAQYWLDQTGGSGGVHKWSIAPNSGTGGGTLSFAVPMFLNTTGTLVLQSTALNSVTQLALVNVTGSTKNNQILFQDSTNVRWRIGTDISTNNNTNNFQIYNDATATSALTVDSAGRFLFGSGFESDYSNGIVQARSTQTGTTFQSNAALFTAYNATAGREVPGFYISDGTNDTLLTQVGSRFATYKNGTLGPVVYKTGTSVFMGLLGQVTPLAPLHIEGAGVYGADANSSYIGSGASGSTLANYGVTGNYALRYWLDSAANIYYWQNTAATGTAGNPASYQTLMSLNSTGLGIGQSPQVGYKLAVTGNQIINNGGLIVNSNGPDMTFTRIGNDAFPPAFLMRKARGSFTSPAAVASGDGMGITYYQGYDGSSYLFTGSLEFKVSGSVSTSSIPTQFTLGCGTNSATIRMAVNTNGLVNIGNGTSYGVGQVLMVQGEGATSNVDQGTTLKVGTDGSGFGGSGTIQGLFCARAATSDYRFMQMNSGTTSSGSFGDAEFIFYGNGSANADGTWNNNGADYAEFFESATGQELPVGTTVVLEGNKVRAATAQDSPDSIMGAVRPKADGTASMVIGNTAWNKWSKKYLQDDFGVFEQEPFAVLEWVEIIKPVDSKSQEEKRHSYEEDRIPAGVVVPSDAVRKTTDSNGKALMRRKLNPDWNPNEEYVPRMDRPEWLIIGLIGQIPVLNDQPIGSRWIKMRDVSARVAEYLVR